MSKPKYRFIECTRGDGSKWWEVHHKFLGRWWKYDRGGHNHVFTDKQEAISTFKNLSAKPHKEILEECPQMVVVKVELDDNTLAFLQEMANEQNITIEQVVEKAVQQMIMKKQVYTEIRKNL